MSNDELLDSIDAMVFSGDALLDDEFRKNFSKLLGRWERKVEEFDDLKDLSKPVEIGEDGLCKCSCADPCPLGRVGSLLRCTKEELESKGIKTS